MNYHMKITPEVIRSLAIAALGPIIAALATLDPNKLENMRVWGISLGIAVAHAVLVTAMALLSGGGQVTKS